MKEKIVNENTAFKGKKRQDTASMKVWSKPSVTVLPLESTEMGGVGGGDASASDS